MKYLYQRFIYFSAIDDVVKQAKDDEYKETVGEIGGIQTGYPHDAQCQDGVRN